MMASPEMETRKRPAEETFGSSGLSPDEYKRIRGSCRATSSSNSGNSVNSGNSDNFAEISASPVCGINPSNSNGSTYSITPTSNNSDGSCLGWLIPLAADLPRIPLGVRNGPPGVLIGRHPECDHIISHRNVSNRHCLLLLESLSSELSAPIYIVDLSSNGTFVNGVKVGRNNRLLLCGGDRIELAPGVAFLFRAVAESGVTPVPSRMRNGARSFEECYQLLDIVGHGHYAQVRRATERATGRLYAVKIFSHQSSAIGSRRLTKPGRKSITSVLGSVQNEISVLLTLQHPNLLSLKESFTSPSRTYLVLDYCDGGELFQLIVAQRRLSETVARTVFGQMLSALQYLHERCIVHRDVKPENVLLQRDGSGGFIVKLADFGLAKVVGEDEFTQTLCGTPAYVAPEILAESAGSGMSRERQYTKAVDMWSSGVVLYICLAGFPPFSEELAPPSMREQILSARYAFYSPYWDAVSDVALDLVAQLLKREPEARLSAAEALAHEWFRADLSASGEDGVPSLTGGSADPELSISGSAESDETEMQRRLSAMRPALMRQVTLIADMVGENGADGEREESAEAMEVDRDARANAWSQEMFWGDSPSNFDWRVDMAEY